MPCCACLLALSYHIFVFPNEFAPSGLPGIATIIQHVFHFKVGYMTILINVPLVLLTYVIVDHRYAVLSATFAVVFSVVLLALDYVNLAPFEYHTTTGTSTILAPIAGGVISGFCYGMVMRRDSSTGGTDLLAALVHHVRPEMHIIWIVFAINAIVAALSYFVYDFKIETIHGTTWQKLPDTKGKPLVSDQSSMFLSKPCNVSDYGMIYAGVQKNVGPAGMVIAIIREDLIREDLDPKTPIYMMYKTHADAGSMYNTPNCWAIYVCGKVFKYLKSLGGLTAMQHINEEKAKVMYDFLDSSKMFRGAVDPEFRSLMNIPFVTGDKDLDAEVVAYTKAAGFENLKGHKSVGGLRASTYNAMPKEGVEALVEFLKNFEANYGK